MIWRFIFYLRLYTELAIMPVNIPVMILIKQKIEMIKMFVFVNPKIVMIKIPCPII
ncbi:MAG: hypothetical protein N2258_08545 [Brevinematales bacterium]|nr:hypothetical protein [Brevinematales bacterium]